MNKQTFWDSQAAKGALSGTQDRYAKELEMTAIVRYVKDGMRVLDVGCGDGETVNYLFENREIFIHGIDFSPEMIVQAREHERPGILFDQCDIKNIQNIDVDPFDLIYTQRALINLDSWEEQRQAILDILSLLKPGGTYVMVECFQEGLDEINELRVKVGLDEIKAPWHNRYLRIPGEMMALCKELIMQEPGYEWPKIEYFAGAYYLMSRVVNAYQYQAYGMEPNYTSAINKLGTILPPTSVNLKGQVQLWAITKKKENA